MTKNFLTKIECMVLTQLSNNSKEYYYINLRYKTHTGITKEDG